MVQYSTAQGRQVQRDKFGRPFRSERTMGPDFSLDATRRRVIAPRSPTVAAPGTPEEVARAFGGPIAFAPGASREQTAAAAARLAGPRFGPGEYAEYQRSIGVNTNPPAAAGPDPDTVRAVQGIVGASPARQERFAMAEGARPTVFVDGQGYMPLGGSWGPRSTTGVSAGRTPFPGRSVGTGRMSSGVTTGGTFGSPLMLGQGPGGESSARQPFAYKPGRGPTITSPGGKSEVVSPEAFQQMWNQMSGNARGGALRMALAEQRERAAADPSIAANIASNQAAVQRQTGGAPAPGTNPLFDRERQRKELSRAGVPRPLAAALANLQGNPEAQAALVEQLAAEETERIQSFNQPFGSRTATGGRGGQGMGVAGVVAAQGQRGLEERRLGLEERKLAAQEDQAKWERENLGTFVPPEQRIQVQAAGEQARQAWLNEHPGDEDGAAQAARQATGGLWQDMRIPGLQLPGTPEIPPGAARPPTFGSVAGDVGTALVGGNAMRSLGEQFQRSRSRGGNLQMDARNRERRRLGLPPL